MKHIKTKKVPAKKIDVIDFVSCDICGSVIKDDLFKVNEIEVRHKKGSNYPEGGSGVEITVDICGKCFDEKLVPWLRSQGADPITTEWDW